MDDGRQVVSTVARSLNSDTLVYPVATGRNWERHRTGHPSLPSQDKHHRNEYRTMKVTELRCKNALDFISQTLKTVSSYCWFKFPREDLIVQLNPFRPHGTAAHTRLAQDAGQAACWLPMVRGPSLVQLGQDHMQENMAPSMDRTSLKGLWVWQVSSLAWWYRVQDWD